MEPVPPPISIPKDNASGRRALGGWVFLSVVFVLLIALSLSAQFKGGTEKAPVPTNVNLGAAFLIGGILLAGLILWVLFAALQASKSLPAPNRRLLQIGLESADAYAARVAQLLTVYISVSLLAELFGKKMTSIPALLIFGIGQMVLSLLLFATPVFGKPLGLGQIGWSRDKLGTHALVGILAAVMNFPLVFALLLLGMKLFSGMPSPMHPLAEGLRDNPSFAYVALALFSGCIQAPVTEETMFRGLFFPALSRIGAGPFLSALITSLVFASIHPTGFVTLFGLTGIACMSCYLVSRTGSLMPSIFMHATHNLLTLVMALVS